MPASAGEPAEVTKQLDRNSTGIPARNPKSAKNGVRDASSRILCLKQEEIPSVPFCAAP